MFLLLAASGISQTMEDFKKADTLFVCFDHGKGQEKFVGRNRDHQPTVEEYYYFIDQSQYKYLIFPYDVASGKSAQVSKSYFRKHKKTFLNPSFIFNCSDLTELLGMLGRKKIIYLVDTELREGMMMIREVGVQSSVVYEE